MKKITELSEREGAEILEFVRGKQKDEWFRKFYFEPEVTEEGYHRLTFSGRYVVGLEFATGINVDSAMLHFDNPKVMLWLYLHGFDITEQLSGFEDDQDEEEKYRDEIFDRLHEAEEKLREEELVRECKRVRVGYVYKESLTDPEWHFSKKRVQDFKKPVFKQRPCFVLVKEDKPLPNNISKQTEEV